MTYLEPLIERALRCGASQAEAYLERRNMTFLRVFRQRIESLRTVQSEGVGLRVIVGSSIGYAHACPLRSDLLQILPEQAVTAARVTEPDPYAGLSPAVWQFAGEIAGRSAAGVPLPEKLDLALRAERAACSAHPAITGTDDVEYVDYDREIEIVNSHGLRVRTTTSQRRLLVTAVAEHEGAAQTGLSIAYGPLTDEFDPEAVGAEAAERALALRGAVPSPTTEVPVIFDRQVGAGLIRLLRPTLDAESLPKGRAYWAESLGQAVASPLVTIVDDSTLPDGPVSLPFDGEGTPGRRVELVADGNLERFLYTSYAARQTDHSPTGHSLRDDFYAPPGYSPSNLYLAPGCHTEPELVRATGEGLYVRQVQGLHTANPVSGNLSLGVVGQWIRGGAFAEAVRGITIAGNLFQMLKAVDMVASDLRFFPGTTITRACTGAPTFRVRSLVVSGR